MASLGLVAEDTIFVSNLPDHVGSGEIIDFFKEYGKIKDHKLPFDKKTGKSKKICFVTFENERDVKNALKADGRTFREKKIRVSIAEKRSSDNLLLEKLEHKSKEEVLKNIKKYEKLVKEEFDAKFNPKTKDKEKEKENTENKNEENKTTQEEKEKKKKDKKNKEKYKDKEKDHKRKKNDRSRSKSSRSRSRSRKEKNSKKNRK